MTLLEFAALIQVVMAGIALGLIVISWIKRNETSVNIAVARDLLSAAVWGTVVLREYFEEQEPRIWVMAGGCLMIVAFIYFSMGYSDDNE